LITGQQKIFGDEIVLTDGFRIYPFPIRLAVRPEVYAQWATSMPDYEKISRSGGQDKYFVEIPNSRVAKTTDQFYLYLNQSKFIFALKFIIGWGIPQMREHMLRANNIGSLFKILLSRVACYFRLLRNIKFFEG
jgi:hypothetical protein